MVSDPNWERTIGALAGLKPAMQVKTGNGTHTWFRVDETTDPTQSAVATAGINTLLRAAGSDPVGDLPRIARALGTINIPTERKRNRGAKLALAHAVLGPSPAAKAWRLHDLIKAVADALDLDPNDLKGHGSGAGGGTSNPLPPAMLRAPTVELIETLLDLLPNGDSVSRDMFLAVTHAVLGAAAGLGAEAEARARAAFLRWAGRYPGSDPDEDARVYDTIRTTHRGWPHLLTDLRDANPAGWQQITDRLEPLRLEGARRAFANAPIAPEQQHLIESAVITEAASRVGSDKAAASTDADPEQIAGGRGRSLAQRAVDALLRAGAKFFHSPNGRAWICLGGRVYSLDSEAGLRAVLSWLLVRAGLAIVGTAKSELKDLLLSRAYVGPTEKVHYRQAQGPDLTKPEAFINLMDQTGDGVHVDATGWRIKPLSVMPVRFTDRDKGLPMPRPVRATDGVPLLDRLARHIAMHPVNKKDDPSDVGVQQQANMLLFLLNQLFRVGTAVHLFLNGPQGAGKTTTSRRLKDFTDSDTAEVVPSLPSDDAVLFAIAGQQTVLVIDNASAMRGNEADLLCGLATGAAQQKRALYSDGDRQVYEAKCSVVVNSIDENLIKRADLMDRTVVHDQPPLDRKNRRTEQELKAAWERDKPFLFADLLDALSGGLARLDAVMAVTPPEALPRFTDAALLAEAAAQSLGWKAGLCLAAINASRHGASERQLEENPYAFRVRALLEAEGGKWSGTVADLRQRLTFMDGPEWGRVNQSAQSFTVARDRMAGPLRDTWGICTASLRGSGGVRHVRLSLDGPAT
ncbi:MAG: hypothetical protein KDK08_07245 [Rhizobiaceae bacterium]|nr:hypothetical protein [Rhizobiaceae bacterium]